MLPSCILCKKRKKRCDFNLPSCKHCKSMGTQCEYFDEGLGNNVPREYLKSLNDNIILLKSEIDKYKKKINKRTNNEENREELVKSTSNNTSDLYDMTKNGTFLEGSDNELHYFGPCSIPSMVYMSSMMIKLNSNKLNRFNILEFRSLPNLKIQFDYSLITSEHTKILISNYLTEIYPNFPLLSENFFHFDLMVKNYPEWKQLFIFLILLISASHLMRKKSDFTIIKLMLQQKVNELMKSKISNEDGDELLCLILYSIYQLLDPEMGKTVWKTISLACDIAEKLKLKDINNNYYSLNGKVAKNVSKKQILKCLAILDSEVSLLLGRPPQLNLEKNQILNIENDDVLVNELLIIYDKTEFFNVLYSNSSNCGVLTLFQSLKYHSNKNVKIWLLSSPLLSHKCNDCNLYYDSAVINILSSSLKYIEDYNNQSKNSGVILYWIELSHITISLINLILISKFYSSSYQGIVSDKTIDKHLVIGRNILSKLCSHWYYANTIKAYIDLLIESM